MMEFDEHGRCMKWYERNTHTYFYDERCEGCKHVVKIGEAKVCGKCEGGCVSLHQVVRSQLGCIWCEHYTKKLDCQTCLNCIEKRSLK